MTADQIRAVLDDYSADHDPGCTFTGCIHDAVTALRQVVDLHDTHAGGRCRCGESAPCREITAIGAALGLEVNGGT